MNTQPTTPVAPVANPTIVYVTKVFDGIFSEQELQNNRKYCFYRVANFISPKTQLKLNTVLNDDEIGQILNELQDIQFSRRISAKASRAGEATF